MDYKDVFSKLYDALDCVERAEKDLRDLRTPGDILKLGAKIELPLHDHAVVLREALKMLSEGAIDKGLTVHDLMSPLTAEKE